jgi:hypothetical protein
MSPDAIAFALSTISLDIPGIGDCAVGPVDSFFSDQAEEENVVLDLKTMFPSVPEQTIVGILKASGFCAETATEELLLRVAMHDSRTRGKGKREIHRPKTPPPVEATPMTPPTPSAFSGQLWTDEEIARRIASGLDSSPPSAMWRAPPSPLVHHVDASAEARGLEALFLEVGRSGHGSSVDAWRVKSAYDRDVTPDLGAAMKVAQLQALFPTVNATIVENRFTASGRNFATARQSLYESFPSLFVAPPAVLAMEARLPDSGHDGDELWEAALADVLDVVCRSDALPKDLGALLLRQGWARALWADQEGMLLVFRALNGRLDSRTETDLHGLTVKESLELLPFLLRRAQSQRKQHLVVITGEGNHSAGGQARLKPAVLKWLANAGFRYIALNPGSVRVALR